MNEQELIIKISEVKRIRFLSRAVILAALGIVFLLNAAVGIALKYLCSGYIVICILIVVFVGFPTQKKLAEYEKQLKNWEEQ